MPLLVIARLTLREAARRRLLHAVAILTVLVIGLTGWGISRITTFHDSNGQPLPHSEVMATTAGLVILLAYMFSFVLAIGAAFLAAPAIAGDVDSGLVLALLPRPLRRSEFVAGLTWVDCPKIRRHERRRRRAHPSRRPPGDRGEGTRQSGRRRRQRDGRYDR